jgi:hypothetical protein
MNPAVKNENGSPARDPLSTQKANVEHLNIITSRKLVGNPAYSFCKSDITSEGKEVSTECGSGITGPAFSEKLAFQKSQNGERLTENRQPFPLSYSRIKAFVECPHRFYLRYFEGLPEAQGEGRKHNGLILRAKFNSYLGNSPTPLLFGENLKRDLDQIEFGVQFLKSKDVIALNIPFALDGFSNPVSFDEPEVVFRNLAQPLHRDERTNVPRSAKIMNPSSEKSGSSFLGQDIIMLNLFQHPGPYILVLILILATDSLLFRHPTRYPQPRFFIRSDPEQEQEDDFESGMTHIIALSDRGLASSCNLHRGTCNAYYYWRERWTADG